jgi:hypothetical protein
MALSPATGPHARFFCPARMRGLTRTPHRAFMCAMGLDDAAIQKPMISVVSMKGEQTPCNMTHGFQVEAAKEGVAEAGGTRHRIDPQARISLDRPKRVGQRDVAVAERYAAAPTNSKRSVPCCAMIEALRWQILGWTAHSARAKGWRVSTVSPLARGRRSVEVKIHPPDSS